MASRSSILLIVFSSLCLISFVQGYGYLYGDGTFDYGSNFGLYRINVDEADYTPEILWQTDYYELGYLGGCLDPFSKLVYFVFGVGDNDHVVVTIDLMNNHSRSDSGHFEICYDRTQGTPLTFQCILDPVDNSSKIITGCYEEKTTTLYMLDPATGNITAYMQLPYELQYNPGAIAYDPTTSTLYLPLQDNTWHSQSTITTINLLSKTVTSNTLPRGTITRELTWDFAHSKIVGLNQTYKFIGPIATDPVSHLTIVDPNDFNNTVQTGVPVQIPLLVFGCAAMSSDGTTYYHGAAGGSEVNGKPDFTFDSIYTWALSDGTHSLKSVQNGAQPLTFFSYLEV